MVREPYQSAASSAAADGSQRSQRQSAAADGSQRQPTADSFRHLTGGEADWAAWRRLYAATGALARQVFPTMTEPLRSREQMRALAGDDATWAALIENPLAGILEREFGDDT